MSGAPAPVLCPCGVAENPGVYIPFTVGAHGLALFVGDTQCRPRLLKDSARVPAVKGARKFPKV